MSQEEDVCTCLDSDTMCAHTRDCGCGEYARQSTMNCPVHHKITTWQIYGGKNVAESFPANSSLFMGSGVRCDFYVKDAAETHAELTFHKDHVLLENQSREGSFMKEGNEWVKKEKMELREGDEFNVGEGVYRLRRFKTYEHMMEEPEPRLLLLRKPESALA